MHSCSTYLAGYFSRTMLQTGCPSVGLLDRRGTEDGLKLRIGSAPFTTYEPCSFQTITCVYRRTVNCRTRDRSLGMDVSQRLAPDRAGRGSTGFSKRVIGHSVTEASLRFRLSDRRPCLSTHSLRNPLAGKASICSYMTERLVVFFSGTSQACTLLDEQGLALVVCTIARMSAVWDLVMNCFKVGSQLLLPH